MATIPDFMFWLHRDLARFGKLEEHIEVIPTPAVDPWVRLRIYTDTHCFSISARDPQKTRVPEKPHYREDEPPPMPDYDRGSVEPRPAAAFLSDRDAPEAMDSGYLGCISTVRKPRAGETWNRGSDLADGPLNEETWRRILCDIVSYSMVRVHKRPAAMLGQPQVA